MTAPRYDVLAIGNALVDVITTAEPEFLDQQGIEKGGMRLIDAHEAERLYRDMGAGREISGGSAANTCAGLAAMGVRSAFVGRVADDQLGAVFAHDIRATGVDYTTAANIGGPPTGRCLIVVTPDGDRTMNTYLGSAQELAASDLDHDMVRDSAWLYLEGYLWDPMVPRAAMREAIAVARAAGRKVAFTLSDTFCVLGHRADFLELLAGHGQFGVFRLIGEQVALLVDDGDLRLAQLGNAGRHQVDDGHDLARLQRASGIEFNQDRSAWLALVAHEHGALRNR